MIPPNPALTAIATHGLMAISGTGAATSVSSSKGQAHNPRDGQRAVAAELGLQQP